MSEREMSESVYFISMGMLFGTILLIFGMHYFSRILQARSRQNAEDAYRGIAEKSAAAQVQSSALLTTIQTDLSDVRTRLAAIEKVLKTVE